MKLYYHDTDAGSDKRDWPQIIGRGALSIGWNVRDQKFNPDPQSGVVFIHDSTLAFTEKDARDLSAKHSSVVLIWISGGGLSGQKGERFYAAKQPVGKPTDLGFSRRVQRFIRAFKDGGVPPFHLLDANEEELLAFRLLCEAAKECGGKPDKENAFGTGLKIHAPQNVGEWLKPFGEYDEAKESERIGEVASLIAIEPVRSKVIDVFKEVGTADLLEKIRDFEGELARYQQKEPNAKTAS